MRRALVVGFLVGAAWAGCGTPTTEKPREICKNGIDDDKNGLADCDDPDCSGQEGCPVFKPDGGVDFGSCAKCGTACNKQLDCLTVDYQTDRPLTECVRVAAAGVQRCQQLNTNVQLSLTIDTATWASWSTPYQSMNTRVVSKKAVDGSVVNCATVEAAAMGKTEADSDQIEKSGKFNLRGYDVSPVNAGVAQPINQPFVNIGTGKDFLIWLELWALKPSTATKLPSGNRFGWGCYEAGPEVAEVTAAQDCNPLADAGSADAGCRNLKVVMPGPRP